MGPVTEYAPPQQDRRYPRGQEDPRGGYNGYRESPESSYGPPEDTPRSYAEYWPVDDRSADGGALPLCVDASVLGVRSAECAVVSNSNPAAVLWVC